MTRSRTTTYISTICWLSVWVDYAIFTLANSTYFRDDSRDHNFAGNWQIGHVQTKDAGINWNNLQKFTACREPTRHTRECARYFSLFITLPPFGWFTDREICEWIVRSSNPTTQSTMLVDRSCAGRKISFNLNVSSHFFIPLYIHLDVQFISNGKSDDDGAHRGREKRIKNCRSSSAFPLSSITPSMSDSPTRIT